MPGSTLIWDGIRARLAEIDGMEVHVGIVGAAATAAHGDSGATNAEIGTAQEYGTPILPERSFIRSTFRDPSVIAEFERLQAGVVKAVVAGRMPAARALGLLGAWGAGAVQETITNNKVDGPALKPATVARKGSSKLLVDTGQLARSVSWVVVP
jgi:hypothetical protein